MFDDFDFHCPCCDHKLNMNNEIDFKVNTNDKYLSKLRLSRVPGVYGYKSDHKLDIQNGDHVDFYCPKCESNLHSIQHLDFIEIKIKLTEDVEYNLVFSPICGEKKTYVVMNGEFVRFGSDFISIMSFNNKKTA